jgi:hypothetical protein
MQFERTLIGAVKEATESKYPTISHGEHCRWCAAKPVCPAMTGAVDRALKANLANIDSASIGKYLDNAVILEQWVTDLRALAHQMLENDTPVPGYKLVAKRAIRKWTDEGKAKEALLNIGLQESDVMESSMVSPAAAEKILKKQKLSLPPEVVVSLSSGSTLVAESDPRAAVLNIGRQLTAALSKIL